MTQVLEGCENHYSLEELYEKFAMDTDELDVCMKCRKRRRQDGGIITCKYILDHIASQMENTGV